MSAPNERISGAEWERVRFAYHQFLSTLFPQLSLPLVADLFLDRLSDRQFARPLTNLRQIRATEPVRRLRQKVQTHLLKCTSTHNIRILSIIIYIGNVPNFEH